MGLFGKLRGSSGPPDIDKMKNKTDFQGLIKAMKYKDDSNIRIEAARAYGELLGKSGFHYLAELLSDDDKNVRLTALDLLDKTLNKHINTYLTGLTSNSIVLEEVLEELNLVGVLYSDSFHTMKRNVGDMEYFYLKYFSIEIIDSIKLVVNVTEDEDNAVKDKASLLLKKLTEKSHVKLIEKLNISRIKKTAIIMLGAMKDTESVESLANLLIADHWDIRLEIVRALDNIRDKSTIKPLLLALNDENPEVRMEAAKALGNIGDEKVISDLRNLLDDQFIDVREEAAKSIKKIDKKFMNSQEKSTDTPTKIPEEKVLSTEEITLEKVGDIYRFNFHTISVPLVLELVENSFKEDGYELEEGNPLDGIYGYGSHAGRMVGGAFSKRFTFKVKIYSDGNFTYLEISKGMSGWSGGYMAVRSLNKELEKVVRKIQVINIMELRDSKIEPTAKNNLICQGCGSELVENSNFCAECGKKIDV